MMAEQKNSESTPINDTSSEDHINDDHRHSGDWQSKWCEEARKNIRYEAFYVGVILILTLIMLFLIWRGTAFNLFAYNCEQCSSQRFNQYALFFFGGMLGGTMFGIKYLYKVVARGYWHIDRRLWRVFTPFLAGVLALAIGCLIDSGMLGLSMKSSSSSFYFSLGFISGYFADSALAKMQEVADTVFGKASK
ncbi:TPA: hypothetical protein ACF01X_000658 [Yersinia enterocolitica]